MLRTPKLLILGFCFFQNC